ncbi:MAG: Na/Pi cotransporter family protein [Oscillospiraceae bacterium]|nr:Na/Pi cotransporter family protein [Oscillospiraceae bacterium]
MSIFNIFTLFGGLALFLFGMNTMGAALEKQAGGQLQNILKRLSDHPAKGFLLGLLVTAVIQSSSATTVMVVGFVNSGIMQLSQAIGIIMGANVGTTVTSWILSLSGLQGDSLLIKLLKPSSFSPVLAFIGIVLYMIPKEEKKKNIGTILLGFAILMTGMQTMSGAVEPLADIPAFANLFVLFQNPLLGMLVGAVLTGVIQSSSASVGILQALAVTGAVTYGSAIPIILGQNIGTTVTAMLSSIGATKNARRAAIVHLYFNIIGSVVFMLVFYTLNAVLRFDFLMNSVGAFEIAIIHTGFNVLATATMLPFSKGLEKLAYLTIPDDAKKETVTLLDDRLLATPSIAVNSTKTLAEKMAAMAQRAVLQAMSLQAFWDESITSAIRSEEETIDQYQDEIGSYLVRLSHQNLTRKDSHTVSILLHANDEWERIADYAVNLMYNMDMLQKNHLHFSDDARDELEVLGSALQDILNRTVVCFTASDVSRAQTVEPMNQVIHELVKDIRQRHFVRLQAGTCDVQSGIVLADLLNNYQRVAAHCSNVALTMIEIEKDSFGSHEYVQEMKDNKTSDFHAHYQEYRVRYGLTGNEDSQ